MRDRLRRLWGGLSAVAFWSMLAAGAAAVTGCDTATAVALAGLWLAAGRG